MKNNLILNVKRLIKVLKGTFFVVALCVMSFVDAREVGAAAGSKKQAATKQRPAAGVRPRSGATVSRTTPTQPAVIPATTAIIPTGQVSQEWVTWILNQQIPWTIEVRTEVNKIWNTIPSAQQVLITRYYDQEVKNQELQRIVERLQQQQVLTTPVPALETVEVAKAEEKGWLSTLFDYESALIKYLPQGKWGAAIGIAGTAAATYLQLGLLPLAATAYAVDRAVYALRTGDLTESSFVERIKNILEQHITDKALYPTFALQVEALMQANEFPAFDQVDKRILSLACNELITDVKKKAVASFKVDPSEQQRQSSINNQVGEYRKKYKKDGILEYVNSLESAGATDISQAQACVSEYLRNKNRIAIAREKLTEKRKQEEAQAAKAAEEAAKKAEEAKKAAAQPQQGQPAPQPTTPQQQRGIAEGWW